MSLSSVYRNNLSLKTKEVMTELQTVKNDEEGFAKLVKAIDLAKIGQKILFEVAVNHEDRIQNLEKLVEALMKENNIDKSKVIVHAPYIINLANDTKNYDFSIKFLTIILDS